MSLLTKILHTGKVAEPASNTDPNSASSTSPEDGQANQTNIDTGVDTRPASAKKLGRSLQIRHVDAGSCNGCELEIASAFSPVYDGERYGTRLVASPRHADALLVTGVVTHNMEHAVERVYEATPGPKVVIAMGECAVNCHIFKGAQGVRGAVSDVIPVDVEVRGCPPEPQEILRALRSVIEK